MSLDRLKHLIAFFLLSACLSQDAWAESVRRVGVLFLTPSVVEILGTSRVMRQFREGLRRDGWIEGKNIEFVWRSAEGNPANESTIFEEFVRTRVDVMVMPGTQVAHALKWSKTIPIVTLGLSRPLDSGFVASMARPGGSVTGLATDLHDEFEGKELAVLKRIAPRIKHVAFLVEGPSKPFEARRNRFAGSLGLATTHLYFVPPVSTAYIEVTFREALRRGADAVYVDAAFPGIRENLLAIHDLAVRHRIPVMHTARSRVESGGLVSYSSDPDANGRRLASFVSRILNGARPGDLPMELPDKYELSINLGAAKAIGLTIPQDVMIQADRVIE